MCNPKSHRHFLSIPTGMGKSRVIAAVVVLKQMADGSEEFDIVFTTELLKSVDERVYIKLRNLLSVTIELVVYDTEAVLDGQVRKDSFVIIDEAD